MVHDPPVLRAYERGLAVVRAGKETEMRAVLGQEREIVVRDDRVGNGAQPLEDVADVEHACERREKRAECFVVVGNDVSAVGDHGRAVRLRSSH